MNCHHQSQRLLSLMLFYHGLAMGLPITAAEFTAENLEFFEKNIRPLLAEHCYKCHSAQSEKLKGGLRLDSREALVKGGETGPAVVPGVPDKSRLIEAVRYENVDLQMPPKAKLSEAETGRLADWIKLGLPWPKELVRTQNAPTAGFDLSQRRQEHWAWRPIQRPPVPKVKDRGWPLSAVDQFLLAKLEASGLKPAPPADPSTLLRRLYFDLIGLPPTPADVEAFHRDSSSDAFEKTTDRLLHSPQFGERWARHWLDLVRYAETLGHEFDYPVPNAWRYRDYVIRAFNADVPYTQFVLEHVAGDLLENPRRHPAAGFNESIIGTGFYWFTQQVHSPVDVRQHQADLIDNQIDVLTKTFLGLTVSCARCHDHKFDAISTKDFYALYGILESSRYDQAAIDPASRMEDKLGRLKTLKAAIRREIGGLWTQQSQQVAAYLVAARDMMHRVGRSPLGAVAAQGNLDSKTLECWVQALGKSRTNGTTSPLETWVRVAQSEAAAGTTPFSEWWRSLVKPTAGEPALTRFADSLSPPRGNLFAGVRPSPAAATSAPSSASVPAKAPAKFSVSAPEDGRTPLNTLPTGEGREEGAAPGPRGSRRVKTAENSLPHSQTYDASASATVSFADFSDCGYERWFTSGEAFGAGPCIPGEFVLDTSASPSIQICDHGRADSRHRSRRLQGVLRSPTFTLSQPFIHILAAGRNSRINVVIDNFQLIRDPIYGGLKRSLNHDRPQWVTLNVEMWKGHRAYLEFSDVNVADLAGSNIGANGYIAVECVVFSNRKQAPDKPASPGILELLGEEPIDSFASLTERCQRAVTEAVAAWSAVGSTDSLKTRAQAALLNWLLENSLLTGSAPGADNPTTRRLNELIAEYGRIESSLSEPTRVPAMVDGTGLDEHIFTRGNHRTPGDRVPRRFLEAIVGPDQPPAGTHCGRLELARRMTDPSNPFLARVMVNRVWHHLFGQGIVASVDNFGVLGERPTHPELLDWLADWFRTEGGWSTKKLIRLLVTSQAYRMSSAPADALAKEKDPTNALLHRMRARRLEGEAIRDSLLLVSGRLNETMFGPSVPIHLTPFMDGRGRPGQSGPLDGDGRRSIYVEVRRNFLSPMMLAYDTPIPFTTVGRRNSSNVPAQALTLMNDRFVLQQAERLAQRLLSEAPTEPSRRLRRLYQIVFGRPPNDFERAQALEFLSRQADAYRREQPERLSEESALGSTGYQPVPSGNLPDGTGAASRNKPGPGLTAAPATIPVGRLPTGAGKLPAPPRFQTGFEPPPDLRIWTDLCHVLFNAKEFVFIN